jgi:hypothetical protein
MGLIATPNRNLFLLLCWFNMLHVILLNGVILIAVIVRVAALEKVVLGKQKQN